MSFDEIKDHAKVFIADEEISQPNDMRMFQEELDGRFTVNTLFSLSNRLLCMLWRFHSGSLSDDRLDGYTVLGDGMDSEVNLSGGTRANGLDDLVLSKSRNVGWFRNGVECLACVWIGASWYGLGNQRSFEGQAEFQVLIMGWTDHRSDRCSG